MKVLVLTPCYPRFPGDYHGKFVQDQVTRLSKLGVDIDVLAPRSKTMSDYPSPFRVRRFPYLPSQKMELLPESTMNGAPLSRLIQLPPYLISAIFHTIASEADLIHVHLAIPLGFTATLLKWKTPTIITCHGSDVTLPIEKQIFLPFTKFALRRASRVIAVSDHVKRITYGLGAVRPETIYLGVDTNIFQPSTEKRRRKAVLGIPEDLPVIGTLCRLVKTKRVIDILRVASSVGKKIDFHILIGGDGPERERLESEARRIGLKNVTFTGQVWDAASFLQKLDIFMICSEREGLSISLQEAMSTGCIPVAVSGQGCDEIIEDGVSGLLFKKGDSDELAMKVIEAINSPWISTNARERIQKKFDVDKNIGKYIEVYNSVAGLKR